MEGSILAFFSLDFTTKYNALSYVEAKPFLEN